MANQILTQNLREQKGLQIANAESQVCRVEESFYTVQSQSGSGEYAVSQVDREWVCECPDNKYRNVFLGLVSRKILFKQFHCN